jgi:hypothetical protein
MRTFSSQELISSIYLPRKRICLKFYEIRRAFTPCKHSPQTPFSKRSQTTASQTTSTPHPPTYKMRPSPLLPPLLPLLTLVSSSACVAGGPTDQVTAAIQCCSINGGTRYQFYANQAICIVADANLTAYNKCVGAIPTCELDTRCIPGGGAGLSTAFGSPTYTGLRETITAAATARK